MSRDMPRSSTDIASALAELDRQLAPLQRKADLLRQMAEIAEQWERLEDDHPESAPRIAANGHGIPSNMPQRATVILQQQPGEFLLGREIWQSAVDRGWVVPTEETRNAMRVALKRLAGRGLIERIARPEGYAYRCLPSAPEPSPNDTRPWEAPMR
jgi:hypothetical protein